MDASAPKTGIDSHALPIKCGCTIGVAQGQFNLPPSADCEFCDGGGVLLRPNPLHLSTSAGSSIQGEQDERVDTTGAICRKCNKSCVPITFESVPFCEACIKVVEWLEAKHLKFCGDDKRCQCGGDK